MGVATIVAAAAILHVAFPVLLFLVFTLLFIILGAALALFPSGYERRTKNSFPSPPKPNVEGTLSKIKVYPPPVVSPSLITASVDSHVQEVLDLTLKHHVVPTYQIVARDEQAFFRSVNPVVWTALSGLTRRASRIDMMKMTQDLVEILRMHFENFRGFHFREIQTKFPQLEQYPYLESPDHELNFLRQACEVLLCVVLSKEHLQCTPLRVLIREYLVCQVVQPTIETLCDPDYINQKLLAYLSRREQAVKSASNKYHSRTYEHFVKNIKKIDDIMELHQMRQFIITDIIQAKAVQKMKSTQTKGLGAGAFPIPIPADKVRSLMERDLTLYVNQLQTAKTVCERQIRKLGGEDYEATKSDEMSESYQGSEAPLTLLPFEVLMSNDVARQAFQQFLLECGFAHLMQFWEEVKKLESAPADALHKMVKEIVNHYLALGAEHCIYVEEEVVAEIQSCLEGKVSQCVPALVAIQNEVYSELQDQFYHSFTCSHCYRQLLQQIAISVEKGHVELQELARFSEGAMGDTAPLDSKTDESHYKVKLQTLRKELEQTDDALASIPDNFGSNSLKQRKNALNKDRLYLNDEIKKLEHYIDHTEEWFGTIGKWNVEVHTVDLTDENEKDPLFIIVVHRPELSQQRPKKAQESPVKGESHRALSWSKKRAKSMCSSPPSTSPPGSPAKRRPSTNSEDKYDTFCMLEENSSPPENESLAGWVVGRKLTDFQQLQSNIVAIAPSLQLPPLPKRLNPFQKRDSSSKYWQDYRLALQTYLTSILKDARLQESEEVFNFLSPASENLRQSSLIQPERKKHTFSLSVPLFSKDEEDSTITDHVYLLLSEVFELDEWSRVLRKQLVDFVQLTYGKNLHRSMQETLNWVASEPMLIFYLELFRDSMWPNGQPAPPSPIRSDEQKARTKYEAKRKFLKSSPQGLQTILGQRNCQIGFQKIFEALQDPRANKQLFYALFELMLYALVPELESVEIEEMVADWKMEA